MMATQFTPIQHFPTLHAGVLEKEARRILVSCFADNEKACSRGSGEQLQSGSARSRLTGHSGHLSAGRGWKTQTAFQESREKKTTMQRFGGRGGVDATLVSLRSTFQLVSAQQVRHNKNQADKQKKKLLPCDRLLSASLHARCDRGTWRQR